MEYRKPKKEINISEEYAKQAAEYMPPENEYTAKNDEYHPLSNELYIGKSETTQKKKKKTSAFKKIRQMGYLVASSAAVVMTVHTVAPDVLEVVGTEFDYVVQDEYEMDDVEIADVIVDVQDDDVVDEVNKDVGEETIFEGAILVEDGITTYFEVGSIGYNGVVWCYVRNGQNGYKLKLMNTQGECLLDNCAYGIKMINENGYAIGQTDDFYVVLDNKGNETYRCINELKSQIYISDNNMIMILYNRGEVKTEDSPTGSFYYYYVEYRQVDGTLVYAETLQYEDPFYADFPQPYNDGYAFTGEHLINENGEIVKTIDADMVAFEPYFGRRMGVYNDGYCVLDSTYWPENFSLHNDAVCLIDMSSGEQVGEHIGPSKGYYYGMPHLDYVTDGLIYIKNYKTYGCGSDGTNDYIFDYTNCMECFDDGTYRINPIAVFEEIIFDDYEYLVAREGDKYFYIDFQGNIVSEKYVYASPFNDDGYAIVFEEGNKAYIINSDFELIHCFENVITDTDYYMRDIDDEVCYEEVFVLYQEKGRYAVKVLYAFETFTN